MLMASGQASAAEGARVSVDSIKVPAASSIVRAELTGEELALPQPATIVLNLRNRAELEARVGKGEIISPFEMAARYYPTQAQWSAVAGWAQSQGLSVEPEGASRMSVVVHGQVAQVASAFQTRFARVRGVDGAEYTSAVSAPSVPSEIASSVAGILRLQPQYHPRTAATVYSSVVQDGGFPPQYLLDQYGATGVGDGTGQIIAIFGFDTPPNPTDLTTYWAKIGSTHTMADVTIINPDNYPIFDDEYSSIDTAPGSEVTLDAELVTGLCPGAKIRIYCTGDYGSAAQAVLNDLGRYPQMQQFLIASAEPEGSAPTADSQYFLALSAQGVTVFAPSGDGGSNPDPANEYEGYNPGSPQTVMYPASDIYVTAVGGTYQVYSNYNQSNGVATFTGIQAELAWADGVNSDLDGAILGWVENGIDWDGGGSGGGTSTVFSRPFWQGGASIPIGTGRCVPDVAAAAMANGDGPYLYIGQDVFAEGTSESATIWTALCAILNQTRQTARNGPIGLLGPRIYPLGGSSSMTYLPEGWLTYLYSVDPNNPPGDSTSQFAFWPPLPGTYDGVLGQPKGYPPPRDTNGAYYTLPEFDFVTGLGIPNVAQLAAMLPGNGGMTISIATPLPSGPVVNGSAPITIAASATGNPTSYQWYQGDTAVQGGTGPTLVINPTAATEGTYIIVATNASGSVYTFAGTLSVTTSAWITNLSARGECVSANSNPIIAGFVTTGTANKSLLIRGDGPALAAYGIADYLPDPQLTLYNAAQTSLASTGTWSTSLDSTFTQVGAFALAPGSHDTALLDPLAPGAYTAEIAPQSSDNGITLAEIYDADNGAPANRLINISARAYVSGGNENLIAGFVITGTTPLTVVIRGDGPGLNAVTNGAISSYLANPEVTLYNSSGGIVASNVGWGSAIVPGSAIGNIEVQPLTLNIMARVGAFPLAVGSADSALVATLPPGAYTAVLAPAAPTYLTYPGGPTNNPQTNLAVGDALVEIYELR
jgi:kumamolisin